MRFKSQLSKILIITFIATMLPVKTITPKAEDIKETYSDSVEDVATEEGGGDSLPNSESIGKEDTEGIIIKELEEKREESIKYFQKDDGTYEAVVYNTPVHYLENGKWVDIDNTLVNAVADKDINSIEVQSDNFIKGIKGKNSLQSTNDKVKDGKGNYYENVKNDLKIKIAQNVNDKKLVSIKKITMKYLGI